MRFSWAVFWRLRAIQLAAGGKPALGGFDQPEELDAKLGDFGGNLLPQPEAARAAACGAISNDSIEGSVVLGARSHLAGMSSCPDSSEFLDGECGKWPDGQPFDGDSGLPCKGDDGEPSDDDGLTSVLADFQSWSKQRQLAWMKEDVARLCRG